MKAQSALNKDSSSESEELLDDIKPPDLSFSSQNSSISLVNIFKIIFLLCCHHACVSLQDSSNISQITEPDVKSHENTIGNLESFIDDDYSFVFKF